MKELPFYQAGSQREFIDRGFSIKRFADDSVRRSGSGAWVTGSKRARSTEVVEKTIHEGRTAFASSQPNSYSPNELPVFL